MPKLNIGGEKGKRKADFSGWTMVDIRKGADVCMDIMFSPLPFPDNSIDAIYSSHTLEHIFPDRIPFVLNECNRVLKLNSPIRVVVPDIDKAIQAYINKDLNYLKDKRNPRISSSLPKHAISYLQSWFFTYKMSDNVKERLYGGHVMAYNKELLSHYIEESKFRQIEIKSFSEKSSVFKQCDFKRYEDCSIYLEAIK